MNTEVLDRPATAETPSAIATSITTVQGEVAKFDQIAAGLAAIEKAHPKNVIVAAMDTTAGMKMAEAGWRAYRGPRLQVETARKAAKAPVLALGKAIDTFAADLEAQLSAGEKHYKAQITAEEERREAVKAEAARIEAERLAGLRAKVDGIMTAWLDRCNVEGMTAERVAAGIDGLGMLQMPTDQGLDDVADYWASAKLLTLGKMENIRLGLARNELEAREAASKAEANRITSITRRIAEIHAAATGHDKADAWQLFEAIVAVEALDVSETAYQEFAPAAQAAQASTLAALRAKHTAAVAREDERAKDAELAAQRAELQERLERLAEDNRQRLMQDASRGLFDALASKPDARLHAREAAASIAAGHSELKADLQQLATTAETAASELAPETVDHDMALAADDARMDPRRSTLALCREALDMLAGDDGPLHFTDAHVEALRVAVDAFACC